MKFFCNLLLLFLACFSSTKLLAENNAKNSNEEDLYRNDVSAISLHGEFLYWTISEGALDYALEMKHPAWGPAQVYATGDYKKAEYNWDPAFRAAVDFFDASRQLELKLEYTRAIIDGKDSVNNPSNSQLFITGTFPQILTAPLTRATSDIKMKYHLGDFTASRVFIISPHVKFRTTGGITFAYIKQKWVVDYFNAALDNTKTKNNWKFWGPGFRLGLALDWYWFKDFYLTGKSSFATLIGKYTNKSWQKTTYNPGAGYNPDVPFKDARYKHYRPAFTGQFLLGPSWQKSFCNWRVEAFAGYELTTWFNLQEIYRSSSGVPNIEKETFINRELLMLHGLTARLGVDF